MQPDDKDFEYEPHNDIEIEFNTEELEMEEPVKEENENLDAQENTLSAELYSWTHEIVTCIAFVVLLFIFVVRVLGVDGSSMLPTLHHNDKVVLLSSVFYTPQKGDIVVFTQESFNENPLVKRVIAVEGQTVDIDFVTHEVWVDGILQDEPYINEPTALQLDVEFPVTVPQGCIFVMGDNRNHSSDSRLSTIGMVDTRCVIGKVLVVIYPFNRIGVVK